MSQHTIVTIAKAAWTLEGDKSLELSTSPPIDFLRNMVRAIVGNAWLLLAKVKITRHRRHVKNH